MQEKDNEPTLDELLREAAERDPRPLKASVPDFVTQARQEAGEGADAIRKALSQRGLDALSEAPYPGPDCIQPYELEGIGACEKLALDRAAHLKQCVPCDRLVQVVRRRPVEVPRLAAAPERDESVASPALGSPRRSWRLGDPSVVRLSAALVVLTLATMLVPSRARPPETAEALLARLDSQPSVVVMPTEIILGRTLAFIPPAAAGVNEENRLRPPDAPVAPVPLSPPASDIDRETTILAQDFSQSISDILSKTGRLTIHSPDTATARALQHGPNSRVLAKQYGIAAIVTPQLTLANNRWSFRLEDLTTGRSSHRDFQASTGEFSALRASFARSVVETLDPRLYRELAETMTSNGSGDSRTYFHYARGRAAWMRRDEQGFTDAIVSFREALKVDPNYAPAHAGLATVYLLQGNYGIRSVADILPEAEKAVERALTLDPSLAEAHASTGLARLYRRDYDKAIESFKRAIALEPSYLIGHRWYALALQAVGRFEEARTHIDLALALDPFSTDTRLWRATTLVYEGKPAAAVSGVRELLGRAGRAGDDVPEWQIRLSLGQALQLEGKTAEAIKEMEHARTSEREDARRRTGVASKNSVATLSSLAHVYAVAGRRDEATALLNDIGDAPAAAAPTYAILGDKDKAFELLERAFEQLDPLLLFLRVDPSYDPLRSDARYERLIERMRLPPPGT